MGKGRADAGCAFKIVPGILLTDLKIRPGGWF
jgi:hypothetical protein